jgi:uncharacterized RDD family membrane protein YckC
MSSDVGARTPRRGNLRGYYAGFTSRAIAFLADLATISLALTLFGLSLTLVADFFSLNDLWAQIRSTSPRLYAWLATLLLLAKALTPPLFAMAYCVLFWVLIGQTPGKMLMGVRVVRLDAQPLTVGTALVRYLCLWLSALPLGLGFLWVLADDRRQAWHDKVASTCVIYAWNAREADRRFGKPPRRRRWLRRRATPGA